MFLCSPLIETAERNTCIRVKVNPKFLAYLFFLLINVGHKLNSLSLSLSLSFSMAKDVDMKESQVLYEKHIHLHGLCAWLDKNMVPNGHRTWKIWSCGEEMHSFRFSLNRPFWTDIYNQNYKCRKNWKKTDIIKYLQDRERDFRLVVGQMTRCQCRHTIYLADTSWEYHRWRVNMAGFIGSLS
jgi:hypothetical protein